MTDQIEQIVTALTGCCAECADRAEHIAWAIHEDAPAGLLASPDRDAAVAAKALREAEGDYSHLYQTRGPAATAVAAVTCAALRDRADRIEREAGESDADA